MERFEPWFPHEAGGDSDKEEVLSFRDLPDAGSARLSFQWEEGLFGDSNPRRSASDQQDFEFSRSISVANAYDLAETYCPADDLFYEGRLLPLWSSKELCESFEAPWSSNYRGARRSHGANGINYCSSRGNPLGQCTRSQSHKSVPVAYSDLKASEKRLPKATKSCMKWQFFSLGLMKAPQMRLDDMRSRQRIRRDCRGVSVLPADGVASLGGGRLDENSLIRRSISCKEKYTDIFNANQRKCKSGKESNLWTADADASRSPKRWRMLRPLSTSMNGCRASPNSVINCSTKKCDQGKRGTTAAANLSVYANQSPPKSGRHSCTARCFPSLRANFSG